MLRASHRAIARRKVDGVKMDLEYEDENEWETTNRCSTLKSAMSSYSYRLTHDLSLDSFQSEDIFSLEYAERNSPTGSVFSNESFTMCNKSRRVGSTSSSKDGSQADKLKADMIELEISDGDHSLSHDKTHNGDEARKLLAILDEGRARDGKQGKNGKDDGEKEKGSSAKSKDSSRRSRNSTKENDHNSSHKSDRRRKTRRKGRKLPQMPSQRPANLQAELLASETKLPSSPLTEDSQSPTDNCQPHSSTSTATTPETPLTALSSSQPTRPTQLNLPSSILLQAPATTTTATNAPSLTATATADSTSPAPTEPVLPHQEVPRNIVDAVSPHYTAFLSNTNLLLQEDSSPERGGGKGGGTSPRRRAFSLGRHRSPQVRRQQAPQEDEASDEDGPSFQPVTLVIDGELKTQSHKALFRFLPRHDDQLLLDAGDPVYVEVKGDDLWYEGINLRTGDEGCFPNQYVREFNVDVDTKPGIHARRVHINRFRLLFLGSVETPFHRGNEVLCRAIQKVVMARRMTPELRPPTKCILEISDNGVRMIDQSKPAKADEEKDSVRKKVERFLSGKQKGHNYYFSLKHISYCGFHPSSPKYFGFITKHPHDRRFACHVFITENAKTAQPLAEAMGAAFKRFYAEFLDYTNPTEDIYLE